MVFSFLQILRSKVTEEQFKDILKATDDDIKFNRIGFGKLTTPKIYMSICNKCAKVVLRC